MDSESEMNDLAARLPRLLAAAGITTVEIDVLTKNESFRGGEVSRAAQLITDPAREEHRRRHFGFWEFVLASTYEIDTETRRGLIEGALRHNSAETIRSQLQLDEFANALEAGSFEALPERTIISLTSHVGIGADRQALHLPMLDMGAPIGGPGPDVCRDAIQRLGLEGELYESGRSYHFIGATPMNFEDFRMTLGRAQLLSPIVDARWVSHQLIDGRAAIRISTDLTRHVTPHRFVTEIT